MGKNELIGLPNIPEQQEYAHLALVRAHMLGTWAGAGGKHNQDSFMLEGKHISQEVMREFAKNGRAAIGINPTLDGHMDDEKPVITSVSFQGEKVANFFGKAHGGNNFYQDLIKNNPQIKDNEKARNTFLSGFIDTNGTIAPERGELQIHTPSEAISELFELSGIAVIPILEQREEKTVRVGWKINDLDALNLLADHVHLIDPEKKAFLEQLRSNSKTSNNPASETEQLNGSTEEIVVFSKENRGNKSKKEKITTGKKGRPRKNQGNNTRKKEKLPTTNFSEGPTEEELQGIDSEYAEDFGDIEEPINVVRQYLTDIRPQKLLSKEDEQKIAKKIDDLQKELTHLQKKAGTPEEKKRLHQLPEEIKIAKEDLIKPNLRLVVSVAKRYINHGLSLSDLIQEGNIGLMHAVDKFDYQKGYKFSTYATWWIRQAITRAISDQAKTVRVPVHALETQSVIDKAWQEARVHFRREPTTAEVAVFVNDRIAKRGYGRTMTEYDIQKLLIQTSNPISLDQPLTNKRGDPTGETIADRVEDKNSEPYDIIEGNIAEKVEMLLTKALGTVISPGGKKGEPVYFTQRHREIIERRFGFHDKAETLLQIGEALGVSRERIRQIEKEALSHLKKLAQQSKFAGLKDFIQ